MSLIGGCICSGNQTSQCFAVFGNENFATLRGSGDQVGEMILGVFDVDFVNQADEMLSR